MKIDLTFKDPDGVYESVRDAVKATLPEEITDDAERDALMEVRLESVNEKLKRWIEYGEYLRVTVDLDANTATVRTNK